MAGRVHLDSSAETDLRNLADAGDLYAQVVLKLGELPSQVGVARALHVSRPTVIQAERMFKHGGVVKIRNRRRPGAERLVSAAMVGKIVALRERGLSVRQVMRSVRRGTGRRVSRATVARICDANGVAARARRPAVRVPRQLGADDVSGVVDIVGVLWHNAVRGVAIVYPERWSLKTMWSASAEELPSPAKEICGRAREIEERKPSRGGVNAWWRPWIRFVERVLAAAPRGLRVAVVWTTAQDPGDASDPYCLAQDGDRWLAWLNRHERVGFEDEWRGSGQWLGFLVNFLWTLNDKAQDLEFERSMAPRSWACAADLSRAFKVVSPRQFAWVAGQPAVGRSFDRHSAVQRLVWLWAHPCRSGRAAVNLIGERSEPVEIPPRWRCPGDCPF